MCYNLGMTKAGIAIDDGQPHNQRNACLGPALPSRHPKLLCSDRVVCSPLQLHLAPVFSNRVCALIPEVFIANVTMIAATRRWFRRNRTTIFISAGVVGAGYVAGQYVLGKIQEARQRMSEERIAKDKYVLSPYLDAMES